MRGMVETDLATMMNSAMRGVLIFMLIYLHLFLGVIAGIVILWRVKSRRRWWGALLSYVCLLIIVSLPFMGTFVTGSGFTTSSTIECVEGCANAPIISD
jgi:cell division protein FtsW (lipid II flippase)